MDLNNRFNHYTLAVTNQAANGVLGTATNLDNISSFDVTQTTAGIALTLPTPLNVRGKTRVWVSNSIASTQTFTVQGVVIPIGGEMAFYYDTVWHVTGDPTAIDPKKFTVQQALVAGNNTITHSLGLSTPFAVVTEIRDVATGNAIDCNIIPGSRTTNTIVLNVGLPVTLAEITLVG
jgi:hypothetical protein